MSVISHCVVWYLLFFETSVIKHKSTLRYIPENLIFPHTCFVENW